MKFLQLPLTAALVTGIVGLFAAWLNHQYQSRSQAVETASIERRAEAEIEAVQIRAISDLVLGDHDPTNVDEYVELIGTVTSYGRYSIPTLLGLLGKTGFESTDDEEAFDAAMERALLSLAQIFRYESEVGDAMMAVLTTRTQSFNYRAHQTAIKVLTNIQYLDATSPSGLDGYRPGRTAVAWSDVTGSTDKAKSFCCALSAMRNRFGLRCPQDDECTSLLEDREIQCL